jgi:RAD51-like protein 2
MQLAVNAALPTVYGGVQGETIYVDTEGSFSPERCHQMSLAMVNHIHTGRRKQQATAAVTTHHQQQQQSSPDLPATFTPDGILQGIHVYRVHDPAAQTAVVHALPVLLHQRAAAGSPVRLIVVDSVAFHHRTGAAEGDEAQYYLRRTRLLTQQAAFLARTAVDFGLAVVAINQMTTQFSSRANHNGGSRSSSSISGSGAVATQTCLVPALGESWAHAVTTRLLLTCSTGGGGGNAEEEQRTCHLVKSPRLPSGQAVYSVTAQGVRGATSSSSSNSNTKRQRTS